MGRRPNLIDVLVLLAIGSVLLGLGLPPVSHVSNRGSPELMAGGLAVLVIGAAAGGVYGWRSRS